MGSSRSVEWYTSPALFADLSAEFGCTSASALCVSFYTREDDGLAKPWYGTVFMNPPYGRTIGLWMAKAWEESRRGALVVCLVPARTDTAWWQDYAVKGEVRFLRGRPKFYTPAGKPGSAPFPSAVVVFRPS
jgi:phage N-6-adenine-methyltransferase